SRAFLGGVERLGQARAVGAEALQLAFEACDLPLVVEAALHRAFEPDERSLQPPQRLVRGSACRHALASLGAVARFLRRPEAPCGNAIPATDPAGNVPSAQGLRQ